MSWTAPTSWGQLASSGTYEVRRFDGSSCSGSPTIVATGLPASQLSYTDSSTVSGAPYSYRVIATNTCGTPSVGAVSCLAAPADSADTTPCGNVGSTLFVNKSGANADLTWTGVVCADLSGYRVYGSSTFGAPFPGGWTLLGSPAGTTFSDPLASSNVAYKVVSVDACGNASGN